MLRSMREHWLSFWFEPRAATDLGICRILFFSSLLLVHLFRDFSLWGSVEVAFWPIRVFRVLELPVLSREQLDVLQVVWKSALALSAVGLFTRASITVSFVLGFYLLGLPHNFGKMHHYDAVVVIIFGALAFSHCGHALSLDRLIARRRRASAPVGTSGEYTWPIRVVWLMLSFIFFAAGFAKLRHSGLEWVFSDNMSNLLVLGYYHFRNADPLTSWGLYAAQYSWLSQLLAGATLIFEIGYPLALFSRWMRWLMVPGMLFSLVGIRLMMGPTFDNFMICHLFWVPWSDLAGRFRRGGTSIVTDIPTLGGSPRPRC